jgi:hypothetical protein
MDCSNGSRGVGTQYSRMPNTSLVHGDKTRECSGTSGEPENTLAFGDAPLTRRASQWVGQAQHAPLQCLPQGVKQNVIGFLGPAEAIQVLSWVSKDMQHAVLQIYSLPRELSTSPLVGNVQRLQTQIARADAPVDASVQARPGVLKRIKNFATKAPTAPAAGNQELIEDRAVALAKLEATVQDITFQTASKWLQLKQPGESQPFGNRFHDAIVKGDPVLVRTAVFVYLGFPGPLSLAQKQSSLSRTNQTCLLDMLGNYRCGTLTANERRRYEAVEAYVSEFVGSTCLTNAAKSELIVQMDLVPHAMRNNNPAMAASVLLGVHDSRAEAELRTSLLTAIAGLKAGGLDAYIDEVACDLDRYGQASAQSRAWVTVRVARLKAINTASPEPA